MKATQAQINICANDANALSDGSERLAVSNVCFRLFPESIAELTEAIENHPINVRWSEYRIATEDEQIKFLLPEK